MTLPPLHESAAVVRARKLETVLCGHPPAMCELTSTLRYSSRQCRSPALSCNVILVLDRTLPAGDGETKPLSHEFRSGCVTLYLCAGTKGKSCAALSSVPCSIRGGSHPG